MVDPKPKTPRCADYLAYIRRLPCETCGCMPTVAAHTGTGGKGLKSSDFSCIPLCDGCHREQHRIGALSFADKHAVDYQRVQIRLMERFIETRLAV